MTLYGMISDPRPGLTDAEWRQWLQLRDMLATGTNIKRKPYRPTTVHQIIEYYASVPAPRVHLPVEERYVAPGSLSSSLVLERPHYRTIDCFGPVSLTEHGDPVGDHPGEIDIAYYRDAQAARCVLDYKSRYVQGWRPPHEHKPLFGRDRFRTFSITPYFEDRCGFIAWPMQTATRWHDYRL